MDWIDSGFITGAADESAGSNRPQKPVWTVTALNTYVSGLLDMMCACAQLMFRAKYPDLNATINPDICTFLSRMKAPLCRV